MCGSRLRVRQDVGAQSRADAAPKDLGDDDLALLVGVSRKSMFSKLFGETDMASRINGSVLVAFWAASQGARVIRTHDVRETVQALTLARAMADNQATGSTSQEG